MLAQGPLQALRGRPRPGQRRLEQGLLLERQSVERKASVCFLGIQEPRLYGTPAPGVRQADLPFPYETGLTCDGPGQRIDGGLASCVEVLELFGTELDANRVDSVTAHDDAEEVPPGAGQPQEGVAPRFRVEDVEIHRERGRLGQGIGRVLHGDSGQREESARLTAGAS